jgi:hypothetical protein
MATADPRQEKRQVLGLLGVSAFVGLVAFPVMQATGPEGGLTYWILLAILLSCVGEFVWYAIKYVKLPQGPSDID